MKLAGLSLQVRWRVGVPPNFDGNNRCWQRWMPGCTLRCMRTTMAEQVAQYLDRKAGQVSQGTLGNQRHMLSRLARWWDTLRPKRVPKSMTKDDLERYVWGKHTCGKGCKGSRFHDGPGLRYSMSEGALNNQLGVIKEFLRWTGADRDLIDVVSQPVKVRKKRKLRLTPDQIRDVIEGAPDPWTRIVCALAVYTAGRSSELLSLTIGDVDLEAGVIEWERHKIGDDSDYLPITSDLADELERWLKVYEAEVGRLLSSYYLIPRRTTDGTHRPGCFTYHPEQRRGDNLHKVVKPELARALSCPESDLQSEGVHTLRRSMARALYERLRAEKHGDPVGVVQALLGHAQRGMTERYIGVESGREERDNQLRGRSMF